MIIEPQVASADALRLSAQIAARAIGTLPETPLTAVGVNVRYSFDEVPDALMRAFESILDEKLIDAEMTVVSKNIKRAVNWKGGVLNLEIQENPDNSCVILFNFHRQSAKAEELREWLDHTDAMLSIAKNLLAQRFNLKLEEANAADDE